MKNLRWLKQFSTGTTETGNGNGKGDETPSSVDGKRRRKLKRKISLGEYKRAVSWSKYLVSSGAEIKGEGEEKWSADMSQLFIGNKFASGRHSRIYRGIYKQTDVAIKLVSQPEEDLDLATKIEHEFASEVALLFGLTHPNIITVSFSFSFSFTFSFFDI